MGVENRVLNSIAPREGTVAFKAGEVVEVPTFERHDLLLPDDMGVRPVGANGFPDSSFVPLWYLSLSPLSVLPYHLSPDAGGVHFLDQKTKGVFFPSFYLPHSFQIEGGLVGMVVNLGDEVGKEVRVYGSIEQVGGMLLKKAQMARQKVEETMSKRMPSLKSYLACRCGTIALEQPLSRLLSLPSFVFETRPDLAGALERIHWEILDINNCDFFDEAPVK